MTMTPILPSKALDSHVAVLGKTGSGKTYAAKGLVELLIESGGRVCIIDPTGAWWGLKSSATGKSAGLPVTIFGGPASRSDMPIQAAHGAVLGEVIATSPGASIIDLSEMGVGEQHRFVEAFAAAVYLHNKLPLHLVIDEANEFAPQKPMPDAARLLGNVQRIAARGRVKGFRVVMISQRPARLNKDVLTQAAALVAMQLTAPQDRDAVEDWIAGQASPKESRALIDGLPRLKRGEAVVWAPDFGVLRKVNVPKIRTYDSSATPENGDAEASKVVLAKVDLDTLRGKLSSVEAEVKANDPKALKTEIARLKADLAKAPKASDTVPDGYMSRARVAEIVAAERDAVRVEAYKAAWAVVSPIRTLAQQLLDQAASACERIDRGITACEPPGVQKRAPLPTPASAPKPQQIKRIPSTSVPLTQPSRDGVGKAHQRILDALAWFEAVGLASTQRAAVGAVAVLDLSGGYGSRMVGECRTSGWIDYPRDGHIALTDAGRALANTPSEMPTLSALHERWFTFCSAAQTKMLRVICSLGPDGSITRDDLGAAVGMDLAGGYGSRIVGELKTLGVITYPQKGSVAPTSLLFPEGLA